MSGKRIALDAGRWVIPARAALALALVLLLFLPAASSGFAVALPQLPICAVQGTGAVSPYIDREVRVRGVVFADLDQTSRKGFFIQESACDADPATSDGIFIYTGSRSQVVDAGDLVEVSGLVGEYFGLTEIKAGLADIRVLSSGNSLPSPADLHPPANNSLAEIYYESVEGMYVRLPETVVVGPTGSSGETWVVRADLGIERVFEDERNGSGEIVCVDDGGIFRLQPQAKTGDRIESLLGVIDYSYNQYRLQLLAQPVLLSASSSYQPVTYANAISLATINLQNLFDTVDEPGKDDPLISATEYQRRLGKLALLIHSGLGEPVLVGIQEAENQTVLEDLVARPEIVANYGVVSLEGSDSRGLDVGLLFRRDRARLIDAQQHQDCTKLVDGLGPDGNGDVFYPQNAVTCDSDDDGSLDGNRLFARPPLSVRLAVALPGSQASGPQEVNILLLINHWKSKAEDTRFVQYTLPRRLEQANFVAALSYQLKQAYPDFALVVLGDLNDTPESQPLKIIASAGLYQLRTAGNLGRQYTYIYCGISQVLDYILVSPDLHPHVLSISFVHANADYPVIYYNQAQTLFRSSDHDPVHAYVLMRDKLLFLPIVADGN